MMKIKLALAQELDDATKKERDKDKKEKNRTAKNLLKASTSSEVIS